MQHLGTKELNTERLLLRKVRLEDATDMFNNWANDSEVTKYLTWLPHGSIDNTKAFIQEFHLPNYQNDNFYEWIIVHKETNEAIGTIGVVEMDDNINSTTVGYCISKRYWNQGLMSEALKAVIDFLFMEVGANRICANHTTVNVASGKVMLKCGMKYEGVLRQAATDNQGNIIDISHYSIIRSEYK